MKTLVLGVVALATASTADARPLAAGASCPKWICGANGTQLTGIALSTIEAKRPVVNAVTLPSGETLDLR